MIFFLPLHKQESYGTRCVQYKCILVQASKTPEYLEWLSKIPMFGTWVAGILSSNPHPKA